MGRNEGPIYKSKAPYNFIGLEDFILDRYSDEKDIQKHDRYYDNLKTGSIQYEIETITPLHISDSNGELFRNPLGQYVIPGNSIRGMTRYNASIFSFSSVINTDIKKCDIANKRYYYRTFASKDTEIKNWYANKVGIKQYTKDKFKFTVLERVEAGYIRKKGNEYIITPAIKLENKNTREGNQSGKAYSYTSVHELELRKKGINNIKYLYREDVTRDDFKNRKLKYKENKEYEPYFIKIRYNTDGNKPQVDIDGTFEGCLANSKHINGKAHHYLIYEEDKNSAGIIVTKEQAELYKQDLEYTNKLNNFKYKYYELPKDGDVKPIFYIKEDDKLIFGFTPYLRLPANGSIHDGIPQVHRNYSGRDFVDVMFGWKEFRTKLSFMDAECKNSGDNKGQEYKMVLGEPKPSWYKGYLKQRKDNSLESYNTENFEIRGRKFYWMKESVDTEAINLSLPEEGKRDNISSRLKCYNEKTTFTGKVRFENLSDIEIGLLIYSLKHGDTEGYFNMGKGKPYGLGKCKISVVGLVTQDIKRKYMSFCSDSEMTEDIGKYVSVFKDYIIKNYKVKVDDVKDIRSYREFKLSKSVLKNMETRYMKVFEFAGKAELPTLDEIIKGNGNKESNKMDGDKRLDSRPKHYEEQRNRNDRRDCNRPNNRNNNSFRDKDSKSSNDKNLNTSAFDALENYKFESTEDKKK